AVGDRGHEPPLRRSGVKGYDRVAVRISDLPKLNACHGALLSGSIGGRRWLADHPVGLRGEGLAETGDVTVELRVGPGLEGWRELDIARVGIQGPHEAAAVHQGNAGTGTGVLEDEPDLDERAGLEVDEL